MFGARFSDESLGMGIPFFTTGLEFENKFPNKALFGNPECIVVDYDQNRDVNYFGEMPLCLDNLKGVCMRKLGRYLDKQSMLLMPLPLQDFIEIWSYQALDALHALKPMTH
jgi:hypothetical protein